jgi:CheY-like chemotaxis protein
MRILVADDEFLIATAIEDTLKEAGAETLRAATIPDALKGAADEALSLALLDVRLGRQTTAEVADRLADRAVPFLFYSGQDLPEEMRCKHPDAKLLVKPVSPLAFIEAILSIVKH